MTPDQCFTLSRWEETFSLELKRMPLLCQGGVAAPIKKKRRSLLSGRRRGGSFQLPIYGKLNEPPRPRFSKERGHLVDGAATPPLPRRGVPFGCFAAFQVHCVFTNPAVLPAEVRKSEVSPRSGAPNVA